MNTVLFVPGFQEDMKSRDYAATIAAIKKQGYNVKFVPIKWARTTIDDWVQELDAVYSKHDPKQTILAGFSYGAMTAFMSATKKNPAELWLFSLSPYFAQDHKSENMKGAWLREIGHRRTDSFAKLDFNNLAIKITCKTLLFVGQKEIDKWPIMGERSIDAHKRLKGSRLVVINDVGHDVADRRYIQAIEKSI